MASKNLENMQINREDDWGDRRYTRDITLLAREAIGPERAKDVFNQYTHIALSAKTEANLNWRKANEEVLQSLMSLATQIETDGFTESALLELLLCVEAPINQAPLYAKIIAVLLFADGLLKLPQEQRSEAMVMLNQSVEKAHLDTGFASNLLTGVLVARMQHQQGKKSLHSLLVDVVEGQELTETVATNIIAMTAVAEVYKTEIFNPKIRARLPQLQLKIASEVENDNPPQKEINGYPDRMVRLDPRYIPRSTKMSRSIVIGRPGKTAGVLTSSLLSPGLGVQVEAPIVAEGIMSYKHFMYLEIPMTSWQPEASKTNVESFISYDALTLYLAIRASRYGATRINMIDDEARDPATDKFSVKTLDPLARHKKIETKKLKALNSSIEHWISVAAKPVAQKRFNYDGREHNITYSWLTQALEQEYGWRFIVEQFEADQLGAHEAELGAYLQSQIMKLLVWREDVVYRFDPYSFEELDQPIQMSTMRLRKHEEINARFKERLMYELGEEKVVFAIAMLTDQNAEEDLIELSDDDAEFETLRSLIAGFKKGSDWQDEVVQLPASLANKLKQYFDIHANRLIMRWETVRDKHDPLVKEEDEA